MPKKKSEHKESRTTSHKKTSGKKGGMSMQPQQGKINPMVGAAVGAAVGGVVGAAAAVALSDKDTRETVKKVATNLKDQAVDRLQEAGNGEGMLQGGGQKVHEFAETKKKSE